MRNKRTFLSGLLGIIIAFGGGLLTLSDKPYNVDILPNGVVAETTYDIVVEGTDALSTRYTLSYSKVSDTEVALTKFDKVGNSSVVELSIPATLEDDGVTYNVVAIGDNVFATDTTADSAKSVTKIVLGDNITSIGVDAFKNNSALSVIELPTGLISVGAGAFSGCSALSSVHLPAGVTEIADNLFKNCASLKTITFSQQLTSIGASAFAGCTMLDAFAFPATVSSIGASAFAESGLKEAVIPENVTVIETNTFKGCSALKELTLNNVEEICESAFENATGLTILDKSDALVSIGKYAFKGSGLVVVRTGKNLQTVGEEAFNCSNLSYFDIGFKKPETGWGDNVFGEYTTKLLKNEYLKGWGKICGLSSKGEWVEILEDATWTFSDDTILDYIEDKNKVVDQDKAVPDTNGLQYYLYSDGTAAVCGYDKNRFEMDGKTISVPAQVVYDETTYIVKEIKSGAFANSTDIYSVVIGENIVRVEANIFDNSEVKDIYLKKATTEVYNGTNKTSFNMVWTDKRIVFDYGQEKVDYTAGHIYVNYPLDKHGFDNQNIHYYVDQEYGYAVVGDVSSGDDTSANTSQYGGSGYYSNKKESDKAGHAVIPDFVSVGGEYYKVVGVGRYAFYNSKALVHLELGAFVGFGLDGNEEVRTPSGEIVDAKIGDCALRNCQFLQEFSVDERNEVYKTDGSILFENGLQAGGSGRSDEPVKIVKAGKGVVSYNSNSFGYGSVNTIENYAFANCSNLTSFDFTKIDQFIGEHAFENTSLSKVELPKSTTVCDYAFMNNYALKNVSIGAENVIGRFVFQNCYSIEKFQSTSEMFPVDANGVLYENMGDYVVLLQFPAGNTSIKNMYTVENFVKGATVLPIKEIEAYAFAYSELSEVEISENVLIIGKAAFENSTKLSRIHIGASTLMIGAEIANRYNDQSAYIAALGEGRLTVENDVYYMTVNGVSGTVRRKVNVYEREVFDGCNILSEICVNEENKRYLSDNNGILYNKDKTALLVYAPGITRVSYTVPNSVTRIGLEAFENNVHLQRLTLPEGVEEVGAKAFNGCTKLHMIYFRSLMAPVIGEQVFNSTGSLTKEGLTVYCIPEPGIWLSERNELWGDNGDLVEKYVAIQEVPDQAQPTAQVYLIYVIDSDGNFLPNMYVEFGYQGAYEGSDPVIKTLTVNDQGYAVLSLPADLSKLFEDETISLKITDPKKVYFSYETERYPLDLNTGFSYITLRSIPGLTGVSCMGDDIDTGRVSVNTSAMDPEKDSVKVVVKAHWDSAANFEKIELCMYIGTTRYVLDTITEDGTAKGSFYEFHVAPNEVATMQKVLGQGYYYTAELTTCYPDSHGTVVTQKRLNIDLFSYTFAEQDVEFSYLLNGHPFGFKIADNVPLLGGIGFDFEMEFSNEGTKPLQVMYEKDKIVVALNMGGKKFDYLDAKDKPRDPKSFYDQLSDSIDDVLKEFQKKSPGTKEASLKLNIVSVFEIQRSSLYGENQVVRQVRKGSINFEFECGKTIMVWVIPIRVEFTFTAKGSLELTLVADQDYQDVTKININVGIEGRAGVGCSIASIGLYGSGSADFLFTLSDEVKKLNGKLALDFGLYAKINVGFFKYTAKFSILNAFGANASLTFETDLGSSSQASSAWVLRSGASTMRFANFSDVMTYSLNQLDTTFAPCDYESYNEYGGADAKIVEYSYVRNGLPYTKTFKFYIDNVVASSNYTSAVGYNEYNYLKLVYSTLENGVWSAPKIVNGYGSSDKYLNNETEFDVCVDENGIHILYRQVNILLDETTAADYVKYLDVYTTSYTIENGFSSRVKLSSGNYYKGSLDISSIDGVLYAGWTENSEWNVLGMSNEATFDETSETTINAVTDKNLLVYTSCVAGNWKPLTVFDQQPLIAEFEFMKTSAGVGLLVVLDMECDIADVDDRQLHYVNLAAANPSLSEKLFFDAEGVLFSIVGIRYENGKLYMRDTNRLYGCEESSGGWQCTVLAEEIAFDYQFIYNADGTLYALGYIANQSDDCSDLYIRLYVDGAFAEEIKLTSSRDNEMVENFATYATKEGRKVVYLKSTANDDVKTFAVMEQEIEKADSFALVGDIECDFSAVEIGKEFEISFNVYNDALKTLTAIRFELCSVDGTTVYKTIDLTELSILSGKTETITVKVSLNEFATSYLVRVTEIDENYDDVDLTDNEKEATLAKADLNITAKYVVIADVKYLLVMVQNIGEMPVDSFTVFVENGIIAEDAETHEYLYELSSADLAKADLQPGEYKYFTIELNKVYFTEDFVTVTVKTDADEYSTANNINSYSMELNEEVVFGQTYMLTYWLDGVKVFEKAYKAGATIDKSEIEVPEKEGFTFSGWSNEVDSMPMHDQGVYGFFTKNTYTVTYYVDGVWFDTDVVAYGDQIRVRSGEDKVGHTFSGWFYSQDLTGEKFASKAMPAENINVYGAYTLNTYTISYFINEAPYTQVSFTYGETIVAPTYNVPTGYTFTGWKLPMEITTMPAYNFSLYATQAKQQYVVEYMVDLEGNGKYISVYTERVEYEANAPYYAYQAPTGYTFDGWYDEQGHKLHASEAIAVLGDRVLKGRNIANSYQITYFINGELVHTQSVAFGASIPAYEYQREGYNFLRWTDTLPETMPAENLVIKGVAEQILYTATYCVDGEEIKTVGYAFAEEVSLEMPAKEGLTFSGWTVQDVDGQPLMLENGKMPAQNIRLIGSFVANEYDIVYYVNGVAKHTDTYAFGASITAWTPSKEVGYTFLGFEGVPATMPASDVAVYGKAVKDVFTITYIVGSEQVGTQSVVFGEEIKPYKYNPAEGYTVSAWNNLPKTMPANDLTVTATLSAKTYTITYYVNDVENKTVSYTYGAEVTPYAYETAVGESFFGFEGEPETMPASNLKLYGHTMKNQYKLNYYLDGVLMYTDYYEYEALITAREVTGRYGYSFGGWKVITDGTPTEMIRRMPANDMDVHGSMVKNTHNVYYYIGEQLLYTDTYEFGEAIVKRGAEGKQGFAFTGWQGEPSIMQDEDVTVTGGFKVNVYTVSYYVNGNFYKAENVSYNADVDLSGFETDTYKVVGWTLDEENVDSLCMPADHIDLHAVVEEKKTPLVETKGFAIGVSIGGTVSTGGLGYLFYYLFKKRKRINIVE